MEDFVHQSKGVRISREATNHLGQVKYTAASLYMAPQLIRTDTHSCPCCRLAVPQHNEQNHCSSCLSEKCRNLASNGSQPSCPALHSSEGQMDIDTPLCQKGQQTLKQIQLDAVRLTCQFWRSQGNSISKTSVKIKARTEDSTQLLYHL